MKYLIHPVTVSLLTTTAMLSAAHSQTVYRCESGKSVTYTHEPCVGAKVVDVTPTEGMDTMTGVRRRSAELQMKDTRMAMDKALQPVTGLAPKQMDLLRRRQPLSPRAKAECSELDQHLPVAEAAPASDNSSARLLQLRSRYRELRC